MSARRIRRSRQALEASRMSKGRSASEYRMSSWRARSRPVRIAPPSLRFFAWCATRMRGSLPASSSAIAPVASLDASSTITISQSPTSPSRRSASQASCAAGADPVVSAFTPHFGEEPVLSGTRGAGNIFLGNCNLRCVYCQNHQISQDFHAQRGNIVTVERLAQMMLALQERGCHNIGFVSPTHYALQMAKAVLLAARAGLALPIVYNTNAYDSVEVLRLLDGVVDVYLPDFKYADSAAGWVYSKVPDYAELAREAL